MTKMIMGGHTMAHNPNDFKRVYPDSKGVAVGHTLESEFLVNFGFRGDGMVGQQHELGWKALSRTEYNDLRTLYETGGEIDWDPKDWRPHLSAKTYKIVVMDLSGTDYAQTTLTVRDVKMLIEIRSVNP